MVDLRIAHKKTLAQFQPASAAEGLVMLIDKPLNWTSFDVVNKVRNLLRKRLGVKKIKVGHAGTLDPLATGLLIVCTGKYTPLLDNFQAQEKKYSGTITLGGVTATYDREAPVENPKPWQHIRQQDILREVSTFTGLITQTPPPYSAVKISGVPAYKLARKGQEVTLKSREVEIHSFDVQLDALPMISFDIRCSKGTYIRSLAHDLGQQLGCGAWLSSLKREAIGPYHSSDALQLEDLAAWLAPA
jgi:tRNA pseudouridine55 synthase